MGHIVAYADHRISSPADGLRRLILFTPILKTAMPPAKRLDASAQTLEAEFGLD